MKYAFIESDLVGEFPLPVICRVLRVTQAGYHAWVKRPASAMALRRDELGAGRAQAIDQPECECDWFTAEAA